MCGIGNTSREMTRGGHLVLGFIHVLVFITRRVFHFPHIRSLFQSLHALASLPESSSPRSCSRLPPSVRTKPETAPGFLPSILVSSTVTHQGPMAHFDSKKAHPSNAGGGGERVLWTAIAAVQRTEPDVVSVVYSGDVDASKEEIIAKVKV